MGTLLLNLGQCGNQLALTLFNQMEKSPMREGNMYLRRQDSCVYHSIMVDTEPKILRPIHTERKMYPFIDPKNILFFQYGRGNNWGLGYVNKGQLNRKSKKKEIYSIQKTLHRSNEISLDVYCQENEEIVEGIINQMRREIEKTDYFLSVSMILSLAGGTGSGLGSRVLEQMSDVFEEVHKNVIAIFPNKSGETPLQHYNTILSSSHIQQYADSIIYFENDRVFQMISQIGSKQIDKTSCIMNMIWINDHHTNSRFYQELLNECCVTPGHKFVELLTAPFTIFKSSNLGPLCSYEDLIKSSYEQFAFEKFEDDIDQPNESEEQALIDSVLSQLQQQQSTQSKKKFQTLCIESVFRGESVLKNLYESDSHMRFLEKKINSLFNPVSWNPDAVQLHFINERSSKKGHDQKMNITMVNSNRIAPLLKNVNSIAYAKYQNKAYLHWYWKYGLEQGDFEKAFEQIEKEDRISKRQQYSKLILSSLHERSVTPKLTARAWVIVDSLSGEIIQSYNPNQRREMASLTKLMTFYVAQNICKTMSVQINNTYAEVSFQASAMGGTSAYLQRGDIISIEDLFYALMLPSGNDAAVAFAENFGLYAMNKGKVKTKTPVAFFIQEMNRRAKELRMSNTNYANPHGLNNKNNFSTASDIAKLCNELLKDNFFKKVVNTKIHICAIQDEDGFTRDSIWENTNKLLYKGFKGIKTGFTSEAGPCLASYYCNQDKHYTIVVLGCRSSEERWSETIQLLQWCQSLN